MILKKNTISIEYELSELETAIMSIINKYPSTVHQIQTILRFQGMGNISSMEISKILHDLRIIGLVSKERKNARVYLYSRQN